MTSPRELNPVEKRILLIVEWIKTHRERFWTILGLTVGAIIMAVFAFRHRENEAEEAWNQLGPLHQQVIQAPGANTKKALDDWRLRFGRTSAAGYEQLLKADLLYKTSEYIDAAKIYSDLAENGRPAELKPLALVGQVFAEEMAGRLPQSLSAAQTFVQRYPDHFMAASMYLAQARIQELTGNRPAAAALYDRFTILYPQSPWTGFAKSRSQSLGAIPAPSSSPIASAAPLALPK